jgi:hypothetical protein
MLIGTLSFEKNGDELTLRGAKRRELIAHVTAEHRPDLLVCAGHSLDNEDDLEQLANDGGILNGQSYLIVEVRKANDLVEGRSARRRAPSSSGRTWWSSDLSGASSCRQERTPQGARAGKTDQAI